MNTKDHSEIVARFFEAIYHLKKEKIIRGKVEIVERYGINPWNFNTLEKEKHRNIFQPVWLSNIVKDYGVSAIWLLTGEGDIMKNEMKAKSAETLVEIIQRKDEQIAQLLNTITKLSKIQDELKE